MCGIWALFGVKDLDKHYGAGFPKIKRRGPDAWRIEYESALQNCCVGFHRLAINDTTHGMQPMRLHKYPKTMLLCNGELYNCYKVGNEFGYKYETHSDVECIVHMYEEFGFETCVKNLDGVYAICLVDIAKRKVFLARDPYGVRPMFSIHTKDGILGISSEAKGLTSMAKSFNEIDRKVSPFKPGTIAEYDILEDGTTKFVQQKVFHRPGDRPAFVPMIPYEDLKANDHSHNIRKLFISAVEKRLLADRRLGCLLSGGLDSSITASILVQVAKKHKVPYKIQTFAIGMNDSPDIKAAREVAKFLDTEHHEVIFTEDDVREVLDEVIYTLETPDITTIRSSLCLYLLSRYIQTNTETTVLFSGEGADEVAQGYIYYRDAPSPKAAHDDQIRLLSEIYLFDGLRADRTISAHGLELRLPFLDLQFTNYYLNMPHKLKQPLDGVEKHTLRSAFEGHDDLPANILWRHKEAFSDGVTSKTKSLFTILQEIVEKRVPEIFDSKIVAKRYPHCTPTTKEALYYREVFEKTFPDQADTFIPYYWMPRWTEATDPSARFIKHYAAES